MPLWPFHRKKRRESAYSPTPTPHASTAEPWALLDDKYTGLLNPSNATPRHEPDVSTATEIASQTDSLHRKRRRSPEVALDTSFNNDVPDYPLPQDTTEISRIDYKYAGQSTSNGTFDARVVADPVEVPHLQPTQVSRTKSRPSSASASTTKRLAKPLEVKQRNLRDREIREMSAQSGGLRSNRSSLVGGRDKRDSNGSLHHQPSLQSAMSSGPAEKHGWDLSALNFLSPRPSVRFSTGAMPSSSSNVPFGLGLQRHGSQSDRLPALKEHVRAKSRDHVNELADDMDATDLRVLMERDSRRRSKKQSATFNDLSLSLEKIKAEESHQRQYSQQSPHKSPTGIHPALREPVTPDHIGPSSVGQLPLSPISLRGGMKADTDNDPALDAVRPSSSAHDLRVTSSDEQARLVANHAPTGLQPSPPPSPSLRPTPVHDPILRELPDTSRQVAPGPVNVRAALLESRLSQQPSHVSRHGDGDLSTPPIPTHVKDERRNSSAMARKMDSWAQFFRRGSKHIQAHDLRASTSDMSFSNASRESMSRQRIPSHLLPAPATASATSAPVRKQSIFREDLPESPLSPPLLHSLPESSDVAIAAAEAARAKRKKSKDLTQVLTENSTVHELPADATGEPRAASPVDVVMASSLATVDSEGSWLTGRRSVRKSGQSQIRSSVGSLSKAGEAVNDQPTDVEQRHSISLTGPETDTPSVLGDLSEGDETDDAPARRRTTNRQQPVVVHRDLQVKSREGLLADYLAGSTPPLPSPSWTGADTNMDNNDSTEHVEYGRGHARQLSTGSAKLLDIPASRNRSGNTSPEVRHSQQFSSFAKDASMPTV